jgi:hypothetical protein
MPKGDNNMANKQVYLLTNQDFENVFNVFKNLVEHHGFTVTSISLPKVDEEAYIRLQSNDGVKKVSLQICNGSVERDAYFNVYIDKRQSEDIIESYTIYRCKLNDKMFIENAFEIARDYLLR